MTLSSAIEMWNTEAAVFDQPADHGLLDPAVRAAWRRMLLDLLPIAPARVADMGSGTGTLSVLLADEGYRVDGVDFSPEMVRLAVGKAEGRTDVSFIEADASKPPLQAGVYDAVLCRHVLWTMPDPLAALRMWTRLLRPSGSLVLIEGFWSNGAGLHSKDTVRLVEALPRRASLRSLADRKYWGRAITDDRYVVSSPASRPG